VGIVVALVAALVGFAAPSAPAADGPESCAAPPADGQQLAVVVGDVACQQLVTNLLGPGIPAPFEYYVPPACAPDLHVRCPVLYLLHGFGGDFDEMVGVPGDPSPWVSALSKRPKDGFESDPRANADPTGWVEAAPLPIILVAPRGRTLDGGYGPGPDLDSYWGDWNPRYARDGDSPRYDTPPPRFESFLVDELAPFVEAQLPAGQGREWRAIGGVSLGGFGAYKNGLQHPDFYTTMLSVSGAHNFLFAPGLDATPAASPVGISAPAPLPRQTLPAASGVVPRDSLPAQASTFLVALDALGDPAADEAFFRGNTPRDLAMNALAFNDTQQVFGIDGFWNNLVADPRDAGGTPFEVLVTPMNVDMQAAFADAGVENTWAIHAGNHSSVYRNAWYRGMLEFAYARLQHPDLGNVQPAPDVFNYRTIRTAFDIWGWNVSVQRPTIEFLAMKSVSCSSITLQGSGVVTVTAPPSCGLTTPTVTVDLGPSAPVDEPANAGATPLYGTTRVVPLA
jgi:S-formylglutathione hydrolase FrmB